MKRILLLLALAICVEQSITAQTNVSGYILSNTTWTLANSPYIVTGNILVNNGVTLTIEPGVTVKFDTTKSLQIDGELIAIGTAQSRITFTATDTTPVRGSWGRIQFSPTSTDAVFDTAGKYVSGSILKYCDIRYGGGVPGDVTVYCDTAAPYFSNCRVSDCLKHAVYFVNVVGSVDSSSIRNCGGIAISFSNPVSADLIVKNDTIENNQHGIIRSGTGYFSNFTIKDCIFTSTGNAIDVKSTANSLVQNNVFTSNSTAVNLTSSSGSAISNNTFTTNAHGLKGYLGTTAIISDNIFEGNTQSTIGAPSCVAGSGLGYPGSDLFAGNITIANNYFESNMGVILVYGTTYSILQGNIFLNNQCIYVSFSSCVSSSIGYSLIRFFSGQGLISNNVVEGTTSAGLGTLITFNGQWEVANNLIKNNSPGSMGFNGVANICDNTFLNNTGASISSNGSSAGPFIHDNEFENNSGTGSTISLNNNSIVNNNEFLGNSSTAIINIAGGASTVSNNSFLNNLNSVSVPIISVANSTSIINNNDFLNNTGLSCLLISGTAQPVVTQNNFINPGVQYEIENQIPFGPGSNFNISNNYWGTTNTVHIDSVIKDYFDDANLSVALYPPVLTTPAFVDTNASCTNVVCALSASGTVVNVSCYADNNGSINLSASNGTTPYTYVWSSGAATEDISGSTSGTYTVTVIDANFCSTTKSFTISQPASPVAVVSGVVTNANCNTGGSINISGGGGTGPYTYNWGSGITTQNRTGLNPGNYSVTVRDNNNCSVTQSFTVSQDAGPIISGVATNTSCNNGCDGVINLSVTGIAPFTYDWGTGFGASADTSGLCAGTYNVTVADSNNCGIAASFDITSPVALSATANVTTNVSCFGYSDGAATVVVNSGTAPYSFLWSDGQTAATVTGLFAGVYDVTVTDSLGCTASASVTLPDGNNVFVGVIGGPSFSEINQSETYIVSANFNYSYAWSVLNGILLSGQGTNSIEVAWTAAGAGLVELIASEQGCADTVSKSVTVIDTTQNCSALFYLYPDTVPHSYFVVNTASGIPQLSYSWNWGDGSAIDTAAYPSHTYSSAGIYTICLTITDSAGCTDTYCNPYFLLKAEDESSAMIQVNVYPPTFTGIQHETMENILVYPNPTNGNITLTANGISSETTFALFDAMGKELLQQTLEGDELKLGTIMDLTLNDNGLYFLRIQTNKGSRYIKIVKQ